MFGIGLPELIVIAVVALLVVDPEKLPDLAKSLGRGLKELKRASEGVAEGFRESLKPDELKRDVDDSKNSADGEKDADKPASPPQESPTKTSP